MCFHLNEETSLYADNFPISSSVVVLESCVTDKCRCLYSPAYFKGICLHFTARKKNSKMGMELIREILSGPVCDCMSLWYV